MNQDRRKSGPEAKPKAPSRRLRRPEGDTSNGVRVNGVRVMSEGVTALLQFTHHDYAWLAQFFSLLVLPFAHEDLAIIFGAYVV